MQTHINCAIIALGSLWTDMYAELRWVLLDGFPSECYKENAATLGGEAAKQWRCSPVPLAGFDNRPQ